MALSDPFQDGVAVTPSDDDDLPFVSTALWIGGEGNLTVTLYGGNMVTFENLPVDWFPGRVLRVWDTGTTCTSIVAVG